MSTWETLDDYLKALTDEMGGTAYILTDISKVQLSPLPLQPAECRERFDRAYSLLKSMFGENFLRQGGASRHLSLEGDNCFVAEPLLTAYLLIILFDKDVGILLIKRLLDRSRPVLTEMISSLPPIDGGPGDRVAMRMRQIKKSS